MKRIIMWGLIVLMAACAGKKNVVKITSSEGKDITTDSLEYELLTFDSKFETWFEMNGSPALYRTKEYYETWNRQYVTAWNIKSMNPALNSFFEPIVGYEPTVDYGFELNHKLFYYFQYVENVLKIPILPGGGPNAGFSYSN